MNYCPGTSQLTLPSSSSISIQPHHSKQTKKVYLNQSILLLPKTHQKPKHYSPKKRIFKSISPPQKKTKNTGNPAYDYLNYCPGSCTKQRLLAQQGEDGGQVILTMMMMMMMMKIVWF